jgi:hypothetical protein
LANKERFHGRQLNNVCHEINRFEFQRIAQPCGNV